MKNITALILAAMVVGACTSNQGPKQTGGTVIGAGLGALAGSQIGSGKGQLVAVAIGALAGALLGSEVGKSLDRADQIAMNNSTWEALEKTPQGQTVVWRNPDSGNSGTVTPKSPVQKEADEYCREYQQTVTIGGKSEQAYGRACRRPDGSWELRK